MCSILNIISFNNSQPWLQLKASQYAPFSLLCSSFIIIILFIKVASRKRNIYQKGSMTFSICKSFFLSNAVWSPNDPGVLNSLSSLATSLCKCFTKALSDITTLTCAFVLTSFAQVANKRVFLDCSTWLRAGLKVQMIAVLALPPKDGWSIRVSLESR